MRRFSAIALTALLALLLAACGGDSGDSSDLDPGSAEQAPDYSEALAAAPPELASLYQPGGVVIEGGKDAFEEQIDALEGYPVVINKWASWCGPCREEFPYLQSQAAEYLDEVAFMGINSGDATAAAKTFLTSHPVPYPSFSDPEEEIAGSFGIVEFPGMIYLDAEGEVVYKHLGPYLDEESFAADIEKYALSGS